MRLTASRVSITSSGGAVLDAIQQEDPTLDLNFEETKTLTDDVSGTNLITFSRASSGTYVDSDGLIKTSPVNLLTYSEQFDQWTIGTNTTVTANAAIAPDGTLTADRVQNPSQGSTFVSNSTVVDGITYTVSVYAKAVTPGTNDKFSFNLGGTLANASSQFTATSEWQRFDFTGTVTGISGASVCYINNEGDSFTSDIYFWGAQLEEGTTATDYIPTGATISGAPRFDHDPVTGESLGLLIEESRTNLTQYSQDFTNSFWRNALSSSTVSSPDGGQNTYELTNSNLLFEDTVESAPANKTNTTSIFAKYAGAGNAEGIQIRVAGVGSNAPWANFNLANGSKGNTSVASGTSTDGNTWTLIDYGIEPFANGWYRIHITYTCSDTSRISFRPSDSPATDVESSTGSGKVLVFGVQVEVGSFPTSYIPTTGSAVTRAADLASIEGTNFSSWYNQSEGTVFVDRTFNINNGQTYYFTDSVLVLNRVRLEGINHYGNNSSDGSSFTTAAASNKTALGLQTDNVSVNGGTPDTSFTMPSSLDRLFIGRHPTVSSYLNGHIARLAYYPTRKTDQQLIDLTT